MLDTPNTDPESFSPPRGKAAQNTHNMPSIGLLEQCFQALPEKLGKTVAVFDP
jgi:hypothetical protein